jgi:hypothetical protein
VGVIKQSNEQQQTYRVIIIDQPNWVTGELTWTEIRRSGWRLLAGIPFALLSVLSRGSTWNPARQGQILLIFSILIVATINSPGIISFVANDSQ